MIRERHDRETIVRAVHDRVSARADACASPEVTIGQRQLLVTLEHPSHGTLAGISLRPAGDPPPMKSPTPRDLSRWAFESPGDGGDGLIRRAIGVATLNALSEPDIDWTHGDPMEMPHETTGPVATVGYFQAALAKFGDHDVRIVEREPPTEDELPEHVSVYRPEDCETAFRGIDVCFLTGSTFVYGGLGKYLQALAEVEGVTIVLIGASGSMLPGPLFQAGIDVVAGARVTDPASVRAAIVDGDCGSDLHETGLEKVLVRAPVGGGGSVSGICRGEYENALDRT